VTEKNSFTINVPTALL